MIIKDIIIRNAMPDEFEEIGNLLVRVYSGLDGFPKPNEQPNYYKMMGNIGGMISKPGAELIVAIFSDNKIIGTVVYFSDMKYYGSGGLAINETNASGFRLLAVDDEYRGMGIGNLLISACINKAKTDQANQLIIHSTMAMKTAWKMYEKIGFKRSEELDFMQGNLQVFGFRLDLSPFSF